MDQIDQAYLDALKHEIDLLLVDINIMSHTIARMQSIIDIIQTPDLVNQYNKDLKAVLEEFSRLAKTVIHNIRYYLEENTKHNKPVDFRYHKILKDYDVAVSDV